MSRISSQIITMLIMLSVQQVIWGQSTSGKQNDETTIVCSIPVFTQYVKINVVAKDKREITNLKHTDIQVYENGLPQELVSFEVLSDQERKKRGYRYIIGYDPENLTEDGQYRKIKIVIKATDGRSPIARLSHRGYVARKGYFTPQPYR